MKKEHPNLYIEAITSVNDATSQQHSLEIQGYLKGERFTTNRRYMLKPTALLSQQIERFTANAPLAMLAVDSVGHLHGFTGSANEHYRRHHIAWLDRDAYLKMVHDLAK